MRTRFMRRGGLLGLAVVGAIAVAAPAAQAATQHPALTWVQGYYYGGSASASGCSQEGGIGYSEGYWTDWTCYMVSPNPNPSLDKWALVVTD